MKTPGPRALDERQAEAVAIICELIIPETTTPGARSAGVPEYLEFTLIRASAATRRRFLDGLEWVERRAMRLFGSPFAALDQDRQVALLEGIERADASERGMGIGVAFFKDIKDRTIFAYYTSRVGLLEELAYKGNVALPDFPGCDHPRHSR